MGRLGLRCYAVALTLLLFPAGVLRHGLWHRLQLVEEPREGKAVRTGAKTRWANRTTWAAKPPEPQATTCFVHDVSPCANGEGVAGLFRRLQWGIALAVKYGCTYVCNPSAWQTGGHGTGNVGHLFGCEQGKVLDEPGRMVSTAYIKGLLAEACAIGVVR